MDISIASFSTIMSSLAFLGWIDTTFPLPLSPETRKIADDRSPESLLLRLECQSGS